MLELVDEGVGTSEGACLRHIRIKGYGGEIADVDRALPAFDANITEAMKSEMGFEHFVAGVGGVLFVSQDIDILGFCFPEVVGVEISLFVEDFRVAEAEAVGGVTL